MDMGAFVDGVLSRLAATGLQSLALAALVWVLCRYLPRLDARTRCWLWWLVAAQMVLGLVWTVPVGLPLLPVAPAPDALAIVPQAQAQGAQVLAAATLPVVAPALSAGPAFDARTLLLAAWLAGVAAMLANTLRQGRKLHGLIARSRTCEAAAVRDAYAALGRRMSIARLPELRIGDGIESPLLARPWRPVLLLPAHLGDGMPDSDLRMALHHELAHLQRRDLWWGAMPALAQHLFFFHPAAHLAAREYGLAREAACDAAVLACRDHTPHDYGRLLVKLGVAAAPTPALAGASPTFRMLKRRLLMLQHTASPLRAGALALVVGVVALGALPYRVVARSAPVAPTAPVAMQVPGAIAAPKALPAAAPKAAPVPPPVVVAQAPALPAPPAPAAPPAPPATPPAPPAPPQGAAAMTVNGHMVLTDSDNGRHDAYVLIDGDGISMAGSHDDIRTAKALQQGGEPLLWMRKDGQQYVVRDRALIARAKAVYAEVSALGERQGALGEQQGRLGERQGALGQQQGDLGARMAAQHAEQALRAQQASASAAQEAGFDRRMQALSQEQERLARQQEELARQQVPLARKQETLARQQAAATEAAAREMARLQAAAIRSGAAQRL